MKKVFTIVAVAVMILLAEKANAQITLHAGYQNASYDMKWNDEYESGSETVNLGGVYAGATYDIDLGMASIYVTPGAELSYCKYKKDSFETDQIDLRVRLWGRWNKNITEEMVFGIFAGPALNIGIAGKLYEPNYEGQSLKKVDLGITFGAQLRYNRIGVEVGYNLGLLNRSPYSEETMKFKTLLVGLNFII